MEAVPRMPMLSFELKISPVCPDFSEPFKRIINKHYGEDGDSYEREIIQLENLRNTACVPPRTVVGISTLKRYYAQIYSLYNRFIVFEKNINVQCVWADVYTGQSTVGDLDFELACILYNIGALHSDLGAADNRQTAEAMKVACTHFQCAAWAFKQLIEEKRFYRTPDLMNDLLAFYTQIMLAQAQECYLEKSMLDNRRANIVAKVVIHLVSAYKSALNMLQTGAMNTTSANSIPEVVGGKIFKSWKKFVDFKVVYYEAIARLYMGNVAEDAQKMGDRVAWYEYAHKAMTEAEKLGKYLDSNYNVDDALTFVADIITVKLNNAKKENDFIYHEKVTPAEQLKMEEGASLVTGVPFDVCDPEVSGADIFARLVPIEAHETASVYSAQKDDILRKIQTKVEEKNDELASFLSALHLDGNDLKQPQEDTVPDELIEICAELSLQPDVVEQVEQLLAQLDQACQDTDDIINESAQLLDTERASEAEHQERWGKRPPSLILVELEKELAKHHQTHHKAKQSNRSLWENFDQHKDDIGVLTSSSAQRINELLPSVKQITMDMEVVNNMLKLFDKVEEMQRQRDSLLHQMVKTMDEDNLLKKVLVHSKNDIDQVFKTELRKYDKPVQLLEMNLAAQDNILKALTEYNARYAQTRKDIFELQRSRKTRIASLLYTHQVFKELQTNSRKGLEFYAKFTPIVVRLNARIRGVSKVQDEERAQWAIANKPTKAVAMDNVPSSFPIVPPPLHRGAVTPMSVGGESRPLKLKDYLANMNGQARPGAMPQHASQQPEQLSKPAVGVVSAPSTLSYANFSRPSYSGVQSYQVPQPVYSQAYQASQFQPSLPQAYQGPQPSVSQAYQASQVQPSVSQTYQQVPAQPSLPQAYQASQVQPSVSQAYQGPQQLYCQAYQAPQVYQAPPAQSNVSQAYQRVATPSNVSQAYHGPQVQSNVSQAHQGPQVRPNMSQAYQGPQVSSTNSQMYQNPQNDQSTAWPAVYPAQSQLATNVSQIYHTTSTQPASQVSSSYTANHHVYHTPNATQVYQSQTPYQQPPAGTNQAPNNNQQQQQQYHAPYQHPQQQYYPQQYYQPPQHQQPANTDMSIYQKLEIEPQSGWTPLTPVKAKEGESNTTAGVNASPSVDALPDILSTMSLAQQQQQSSLTKETIVNGGGNNGQTNADQESDKPENLLSEFDPLFT